ncbi:hypothetical protein GCM10009740_16000 [Terrabacter terrae]|uniref:SHOCT domain-containing protein n=2 Tax=Terrabacter terrae TaxID=318434 RepID=A0ABN2U270_9MICO
MWLLMAAGTIGFWVLIAILVRAILSDRAPGPGPALVPSPLHVLADRLARGEITLEEYEQRRRALTGVSAPLDRPLPSSSPASASAGSPSAASPKSPLSVPDPTKDRHRTS